mmetsp:Transcript_28537/g.45777  ORF Transcript_28537/g.45777 Transcript_28537/m.45777 type:complete len:307 (-) Transcript_28537:5189-6109(-)
MASPTTTAADTNANDGAGNSNNHAHPDKGPPPRAPSRENRILKRVMSIPSIDEMGQVFSKADGKDRVVGLLQYIALFASGGRPGPLTSIGLGLNDARRPFRLYKPIESMLPILKGPKGKGVLKALEYVKAFSMAAYVSCDHLVWAGQVGALSQDTTVMKYARRISFGGWALGSSAMAVAKLPELTDILRQLHQLGKDAEIGTVSAVGYADRKVALEEKALRVILDVVSGSTQAIVALALLGAIPLEKRKLSLLGMFMSLVGIYQILMQIPLPELTPPPSNGSNLPPGAPTPSISVDERHDKGGKTV